jgi:hypothetical protein
MKDLVNKFKEQIITIEDCKVIRGILDVATRRGAIRGSELSTVGEMYDKLTKVIDINTNAQQQNEGGEKSNG